MPEDQDKALAWEQWDRGVCSTCGTRPDEWIDPDTGRPLDPPPYVAVPSRCHGDIALKELRDELDRDDNTKGVHLHLEVYDPERHDAEDDDDE